MKISFAPEKIKRIVHFVHEMEKKNGSFYDAKGQFSKDKRLKDKLLGTVGEMYLDQFLNANYEHEILDIYPKGRSSKFEPDLVKNNLRISVKTQSISAAERFGPGFVFEKADRITTGNSDCTHIAGLIVNDKTPNGLTYSQSVNFWEITELAWIPAKEISKYLVPTKLYPELKVFLDLNLIPKETLIKYNQDFKNNFTK